MYALPNLDLSQRYTIVEAMAYLRISRARLYAKVKAGEIEIIKDGSRSFIPGSEIAKQSALPAEGKVSRV